MKYKLKYVILILMCFFMSKVGAQEKESPHVNKLNVRNAELIKKQNKVNQEFRQEFKKSLTQEQIKILKNKDIKLEQKRKIFHASLSRQQLKMIKLNRQIINVNRKQFRKTLNRQQRQQMKRGMHSRNSYRNYTSKKRRKHRTGIYGLGVI